MWKFIILMSMVSAISRKEQWARTRTSWLHKTFQNTECMCMSHISYLRDHNLTFKQFLNCWLFFSMCVFLASFCWHTGAKILLVKLQAKTIKSWNKICKLKIHEWKLNHKCINTEGTAVKILASKFLMAIQIMTKHYNGSIFGTPSTQCFLTGSKVFSGKPD